MTKVITFDNFKDSVGKTANSTMSALELSNRNLKILLVDLDPQVNVTNIYLKSKANLTDNVGQLKKQL